MKTKTKLLLIVTLFVSFFGGVYFDRAFYVHEVIIGKTTPEWAFLDSYTLWKAKRKALKGDHDALMDVLTFYRFSMDDERQCYFWCRVGEKNGDKSCEAMIREFNEIHKGRIRTDVSLEQHFLDGGLSDDVIEAYEAR